MKSIKDLLQRNLKKNFVGRTNEIELFKELIHPSGTCLLLYIQGQGGQGKSSLLRYYASYCEEASIPFVFLDGRHVEANQHGFNRAFQEALQHKESQHFLTTGRGQRVVLFIDSYEKLSGLDDWLRLHFFPGLPASVFVVVAGRNEPDASWKTDPSWKDLLKYVSLPELTRTESRDLLGNRNIKGDIADRIIDFTHGNALALSIVADTLEQNPEEQFVKIDSPDVVRRLLDQFVEEVPDDDHRTALELCSIVHTTTEKLLKLVCGEKKATRLFNWLSSLTFIEKGPIGLNPHDIVREVIVSELSWRNPEKLHQLLYKTRMLYTERILSRSGAEQKLLLYALLYLHRFNPGISNFFNFEDSIFLCQETATPDDWPAIIAIMEKYFNRREARECFTTWLYHPATTVWVYRSSNHCLDGFALHIETSELSQPTHDPVINRIIDYLKPQKLLPGEKCPVFRYWMSDRHYQAVSSVQSAFFASLIQFYGQPGIAIGMISMAQPERYQLPFDYWEVAWERKLDYTEEEQAFGFYVQDWRKVNIKDWLANTNLKGIDYLQKPPLPVITSGSLTPALSQKTFAAAMTEALKHLDHPNKLTKSPLITTNLVQKNIPKEYPDINQALVLADKIKEAINSIRDVPRHEQFYRLLYRTYINPAGSRAAIADFLNMSFSTYRRQLKAAVDWITEVLWVEENQLGLLEETND